MLFKINICKKNKIEFKRYCDCAVTSQVLGIWPTNKRIVQEELIAAFICNQSGQPIEEKHQYLFWSPLLFVALHLFGG